MLVMAGVICYVRLMFQSLLPLAAFIAGGLLSAVLCGLWLRRRLAVARDETALLRMTLEARYAELSDTRAALSAEQARAARLPELETLLEQERLTRSSLEVRLARIETEREEQQRRLEEKIATLTDLREAMTREFQAAAEQSLRGSQQAFFELANQSFAQHQERSGEKLNSVRSEFEALVAPLRDVLGQYQTGLQDVERVRADAYGSLRAQIAALAEDQHRLRSETQKLTHALRSGPKTRGRWGEQQLRNVLEMAGLSEHVDFRAEVHVATDDGRLRPDAVVRLPGGRQLVIDAKTSLNAYQEALDTQDDAARHTHMRAHAEAMRLHVEQLGGKNYWSQFKDTPDFVVMFVAGEHFVSAALEINPALWEYAFEKRVLIATPTNLIALARTIALGWRQERLAEQAQQIGGLGKELYQRLIRLGERVQDIGRKIGATVKSYNEFVGTLETSVLPQARKFSELQGVEGPETLEPVEAALRPLAGRDLSLSPPADAA